MSVIQAKRREIESRAATDRVATQDELRAWIEVALGGTVTLWQQISGGNRCRSWAVDVLMADGTSRQIYLRYQPPRPPSVEPYTVWREAVFYKALDGSDVPAPRLIAVHGEHQAILTERVSGRADFRRLKASSERETIAQDFVGALARLHRLPATTLGLPGLAPGATIADCVRLEIDTWKAMYAETGRTDPLIDLALEWLLDHIPTPAEAPAFVHGDAGPGNFLFENGRMTALLDWELAHAGDPMEDLAWFSMRSVMEPVPDFAARIREYGVLSGAAPDFARIRYHRVFVSTRVVIIRHRNVTGEPGNSIVSRALNRRLLVSALAEATGVAITSPDPFDPQDTPQTALFDHVIDSLQHEIAGASSEGSIIAAAKDSAKVLKYLRAVDQLGDRIAAADAAALASILGECPKDVESGKAALLQALAANRVEFAAVLEFFAGNVAREAELAAASSGGLAHRQFPPLEDRSSTHG